MDEASQRPSRVTIGDVSLPLPSGGPRTPAFVPLLPSSLGWMMQTQEVPTNDSRQQAPPELNPYTRAHGHMPQVLQVLRWMMQKDQLAQDMLLLGYLIDHPIRSWQPPDILRVYCARSPPGELRRRIALRFCEVAQREYEFISLSRDTTEADLKQRREIVGNSVRFVGTLIMRNHQVVHDDTTHGTRQAATSICFSLLTRSRDWTVADQAAVRAAIEGRVLILEGIEKAERNILPLLNNLLENREMVNFTAHAHIRPGPRTDATVLPTQALEDGRFLMNAKRYDKLLETHTEAEMHRLGLIRVDPNFRVISLSLPVPLLPSVFVCVCVSHYCICLPGVAGTAVCGESAGPAAAFAFPGLQRASAFAVLPHRYPQPGGALALRRHGKALGLRRRSFPTCRHRYHAPARANAHWSQGGPAAHALTS